MLFWTEGREAEEASSLQGAEKEQACGTFLLGRPETMGRRGEPEEQAWPDSSLSATFHFHSHAKGCSLPSLGPFDGDSCRQVRRRGQVLSESRFLKITRLKQPPECVWGGKTSVPFTGQRRERLYCGLAGLRELEETVLVPSPPID